MTEWSREDQMLVLSWVIGGFLTGGVVGFVVGLALGVLGMH